MRLARWNWGGRFHAGTVSADGREVTPLLAERDADAMLILIRRVVAGEGLPAPSGARLPLEAVTLGAPIGQPFRNLLCIGRNYRSHAAELATTVFREAVEKNDGWPIVFTKLPETVIGPFDTVRLPPRSVTEEIDYESELAVIIGAGGRDISRSQAMQHVFGYTVVNDVSARDVQVRHQQWMLGKSFDTFCPMGPWIVTADELDGRNTRVRGWVTPAGGSPELRQDGMTRDMIFDIPSLIETCSRGITLKTGDIIATGTPSGVAMGFKPPKWLRAGDVVRVEVDGIGAIENRFQ